DYLYLFKEAYGIDANIGWFEDCNHRGKCPAGFCAEDCNAEEERILLDEGFILKEETVCDENVAYYVKDFNVEELAELLSGLDCVISDNGKLYYGVPFLAEKTKPGCKFSSIRAEMQNPVLEFRNKSSKRFCSGRFLVEIKSDGDINAEECLHCFNAKCYSSIEDFKRCSSDADCIKVQESCCSCSQGGKNTAINKNELDAWLSMLSCDSALCIAVMSDHYSCRNFAKAKCLGGVCTIACDEGFVAEYRCDGKHLQQAYIDENCNLSWETIKECPHGCENGRCIDCSNYGYENCVVINGTGLPKSKCVGNVIYACKELQPGLYCYMPEEICGNDEMCLDKALNENKELKKPVCFPKEKDALYRCSTDDDCTLALSSLCSSCADMPIAKNYLHRWMEYLRAIPNQICQIDSAKNSCFAAVAKCLDGICQMVCEAAILKKECRNNAVVTEMITEDCRRKTEKLDCGLENICREGMCISGKMSNLQCADYCEGFTLYRAQKITSQMEFNVSNDADLGDGALIRFEGSIFRFDGILQNVENPEGEILFDNNIIQILYADNSVYLCKEKKCYRFIRDDAKDAYARFNTKYTIEIQRCKYTQEKNSADCGFKENEGRADNAKKKESTSNSGGSATVISGSIFIKKQKLVHMLKRISKKIAEVKLKYKDLPVVKYRTALASESNKNIFIETDMLKTIPSTIQKPKGRIYKAMKIKLRSGEENIKKLEIEFKVEKKWLEDKGIGVKSIVLARYDQNVWQELPTEFLREDEEFYYFLATTEKNSYFVILAKETPKNEKEKGNKSGVEKEEEKSILEPKKKSVKENESRREIKENIPKKKGSGKDEPVQSLSEQKVEAQKKGVEVEEKNITAMLMLENIWMPVLLGLSIAVIILGVKFFLLKKQVFS
ncbi:MAG: hypothetical protein DRO04_01890, partial [Candidatus Iainarchaeum archaeon]